ncbi:N-alpha-acetyltransferase 30 [Histomonas meleagridis]|uniref:N-alpha-acetyltransferase 30 n=1 Tax=Histomonas meleagridis TaxID=135588 RepID=UPI00355A2E3D|nr:N-alpha-acetyltransferase 30 [Histomonas meleagridis]KAH0800185.1 N-alpha-acetyltransferase 30 [Histomonas meleagridis]
MDCCPQHCLVATYNDEIVGTIIGRETPKENFKKGYIAMLVVLKQYRKCGIGRNLAVQLINEMKKTCKVVSLDAEYDNVPALHLYESLGFVRTKRLFRYYLNGNQAYRLKIWFP